MNYTLIHFGVPLDWEHVTPTWANYLSDWGSDWGWGIGDDESSDDLSDDAPEGDMLQIGGRAINIAGEIPYCVNGNWNDDTMECDCFPGFVRSADQVWLIEACPLNILFNQDEVCELEGSNTGHGASHTSEVFNCMNGQWSGQACVCYAGFVLG